MSTKKQRCLMLPALVAVLVSFLGGWSSAGVVWDGSGDPVTAGFEDHMFLPGAEPDGVPPDPYTFDYYNGQSWAGIMYQDTSPWTDPNESKAYYSLPTATAATEMVRANGWTVETRVQVGSNSSLYGVAMVTVDDVGGLMLFMSPTEILVFDSELTGYPTPAATIPITIDFHDIRVQVAAGSLNADVFVDNMVTSAATIPLSTVPGSEVTFGDLDSYLPGLANWDHIAVNAPAPAPTTLPPLNININATFETGALPTDFGMTVGGGIDPVTNVSGGVWTNSLPVFQSSYWYGASGLAGIADIEGSVIHGFAVIGEATLTGTGDDQTLIYLTTDLVPAEPARFAIFFKSGEMAGYEGSDINGFSVPVANQDSKYHTYGWELDFSTGILKLFFDNEQVGDDIVLHGNGDGENLYFGDAAAGSAHSEVWDRFVIAEGAYSVLPGDANGDGKVDVADATILAINWQQTGAVWSEGDFDGDGAVTDVDATIMATNWHVDVAAVSAAVPEPGMVALLAGLALGFALYRRGK